MWNPVPLVGVLGRPQCSSCPGCAVALVGCTAFAVMGNEPHGGIFGFWPLRSVRVPRLFFFSFPGRAVAFWGHASLAVWDNFWSSPGCAVSLVGCTAFAAWGNFLSFGGSRSLWWPLGLSACGKFFVGGGGGEAWPPMSHSFLCSGGVRSPGEVGVLGHPGFWCRPGAGLALSPGSQRTHRRALHSLRGPSPARHFKHKNKHRIRDQIKEYEIPIYNLSFHRSKILQFQ